MSAVNYHGSFVTSEASLFFTCSSRTSGQVIDIKIQHDYRPTIRAISMYVVHNSNIASAIG